MAEDDLCNVCNLKPAKYNAQGTFVCEDCVEGEVERCGWDNIDKIADIEKVQARIKEKEALITPEEFEEEVSKCRPEKGLRQKIEKLEQIYWQCNNCNTMYPDQDNSPNILKRHEDYCIICGGDMKVNSTKRRMVLTFDAFAGLDDVKAEIKKNHNKVINFGGDRYVLNLLDSDEEKG